LDQEVSVNEVAAGVFKTHFLENLGVHVNKGQRLTWDKKVSVNEAAASDNVLVSQLEVLIQQLDLR